MNPAAGRLSPLVSVIVPVYNDKEGLRKCLRALARQDYPRDRYEVLVVDNNSAESPEDVVAEFGPGCQLLRETRRGSYAARNKGIEHARGNVLAFTDADCIPDHDWLRRGVEAVMRSKKTGLIGGRIQVEFVPGARRTMFSIYDYIYAFPQEEFVAKSHFAATANMFTRRDVIERVGVFEDKLQSNGDKDWGNRVHDAGLQICYAPEVIVQHPPRDSLKEQWNKIARIMAGQADRRIINGMPPDELPWFKILRKLIKLQLRVPTWLYQSMTLEEELTFRERLKLCAGMWVIKNLYLVERVKTSRQSNISTP